MRWALAAGGEVDGYGMVKLPDLGDGYAAKELRRHLKETGLTRSMPAAVANTNIHINLGGAAQ
jgi:hypothetical protein